MALTAKKQRFANEYLIDLNATQAAIRAGYSAKTAYSQGQRLLKDVDVQKAIAAAQAERSAATKIDAGYVLARLVEIDQMDVLDILADDMSIKPIHQWPKVWRQYLAGFDVSELFEGRGDEREMVGFLKKLKWPDKVKNLELLGKHVGVNAFRENVHTEHSGSIELTGLTDEQLEARIAQLSGKG